MRSSDLSARAVARVVIWARTDLALRYADIGTALYASARSVRRWERFESVPQGQQLRAIHRLHSIRQLLTLVFQRKAEAMLWLHSPVPALRGRTPVDAIRRGASAKVLQLLASIESGVFV